MQKLVLILGFILFSHSTVFASVSPFADEKNHWGLKDEQGVVIVKPAYKKMIALGESSYIVQKGYKYGQISNDGTLIVPIKYPQAERLMGRYFKAGTGMKYALYNEHGQEILSPEYSAINIMYGGMFLTCKNYKYGLVDFAGNVILENKFEDIYMPEPNVMRIKYLGQYYEIEQIKGDDFVFPEDILTNTNYKVSEILENPVASVGYSAVTFTDYLLKVFSSVSPAHEQTVDSLLFYNGADAISTTLKFSWLPKYPVVFAKNYYNIIKNPNNGPLSEVKSDLKQKL
jgi:hypothetical protein